jgi:chemotaxis response regulator CheB
VVASADTAVVHGMPRAVALAGAASRSMPLPALGAWVARWMRGEDEA